MGGALLRQEDLTCDWCDITWSECRREGKPWGKKKKGKVAGRQCGRCRGCLQWKFKPRTNKDAKKMLNELKEKIQS